MPSELSELLPLWGATSVWEQSVARWRAYPGEHFELPEEFPQLFPEVTTRWEEEAKVDWAARYQATLSPIPVGQRFVILPSPGLENPWPSRIPLRLVPGAAFGTGEHFTTASCMRAFETLSPVPKRVLDAGCGSGILGAAAVLSGSSTVVAFDVDPEAVRVSRETAEENGTPFELFVGGVEDATGEFDCVFANLLAETLIENMAGLSARVVEGGWLLGSGIMFEKGEGVKRAAEAQALHLVEMRTDGCWWTFRWRKGSR